MDIEIIEERDNPLLNRREIEFRIRFKGPTPPRNEIRNKLISFLNSDKKLTILDSYKTEFGTNVLRGFLKIYGDEKSMRVEPKHKILKNFPEKVEKKEGEEKAEKG